MNPGKENEVVSKLDVSFSLHQNFSGMAAEAFFHELISFRFY